MKKILKIVNYLRFCLIAPGVDWNNKKIIMDINRWKEVNSLSGNMKESLITLLSQYKEFRSLFLYRNSQRFIYRKLIRIVYPPLNSLYLKAKEIGGGLYILHGFSTIISAEHIGENCWISQQITVGYNGHDGSPFIGDNVMIACGAKVLGNINIGNNVTIGANAVVLKDVEDDCVMAGVPAKKIR